MFYRLSDGHPLPYDPIKAIVVPRPIAWIGTRGEFGDNLAPYSFFNLLSKTEIGVSFSDDPRDGTQKDTLRNILERKVFTVSIPSADQREAVVASSAPLALGESEFEVAGVEKAEAREIDAPYVANTFATLECTFRDQLALSESTLIIGTILAVRISDDVLEDGILNSAKAKPLARLGYRDYTHVEKTYQPDAS